jgi:hypothetical protein
MAQALGLIGRLRPLEERVAELVRQDSPLMQAARAEGLQMAQRRGLLNSSLAAGEAMKAALGVAVPIASQAFGTEADLLKTEENIQAQRADTLGRSFVPLIAAYQQAYADVLKDQNISSTARNATLQYLARLNRQASGFLAQLYGVDFQFPEV